MLAYHSVVSTAYPDNWFAWFSPYVQANAKIVRKNGTAACSSGPFIYILNNDTRIQSCRYCAVETALLNNVPLSVDNGSVYPSQTAVPSKLHT
jgi:hypothetical protein